MFTWKDMGLVHWPFDVRIWKYSEYPAGQTSFAEVHDTFSLPLMAPKLAALTSVAAVGVG